MSQDGTKNKQSQLNNGVLLETPLLSSEENIVRSVIAQVEGILKGKQNSQESLNKGDFYYELGKRYLRDLIIDTYKKQKPFTSGQEGEVFKIDIGIGKKVLLLKRKFKKGRSSEFDLHQIAHELSLKSKSQVKVPTPYDCFVDDENELILMEFIEGRTLYNLQWQAIVKDILLVEVEKEIQRKNNLKLKSRFEEYKHKYLKNGVLDFENDSICEDGVLELLFLMYEEGITKENPGNTEYKGGKKHYVQLEKIYKDNLFKVGIFDSQSQKDSIIKSLKAFLNDIHAQGFFHRDLGGNPRNIILNKQSDKVDTTIIDFGKSEKLTPGTKSSYYNEATNANYDQDNDIISILQSMKVIEKNPQNQLLDEMGFEDIISKANSLGIEMSKEYIIGNFNFLKSRNKTIKKLINGLIEGKDKNFGNYIFLKEKLDDYELTSTQKGKKELFIMLYSLEKIQREELMIFLEDLLKNNKKTLKYKYAKLISDYIEEINSRYKKLTN